MMKIKHVREHYICISIFIYLFRINLFVSGAAILDRTFLVQFVPRLKVSRMTCLVRVQTYLDKSLYLSKSLWEKHAHEGRRMCSDSV